MSNLTQQFDVHFSLNGFFSVNAKSFDDASNKVSNWLNDSIPSIEALIKTGVGVEICDVLKVKVL